MLQNYLRRLHNTITSRKYINCEELIFDEHPDEEGYIEGRLRFPDGSLLDFDEVVVVHDEQIIKTRYAYHYQDASNKLVFRYDNASHHPYIFTYPHHKHVGSAVEPSPNPDLGDVLSEIEKLMWAE